MAPPAHRAICAQRTPSCVNVPWPDKGMGDADYLYAFQSIIMPIAFEFAPDMVLSEPCASPTLRSLTFVQVSAGFDAADGDILGQCHVSPAGYAHMTHMLLSLAGGKVCVALEVRHRPKRRPGADLGPRAATTSSLSRSRRSRSPRYCSATRRHLCRRWLPAKLQRRLCGCARASRPSTGRASSPKFSSRVKVGVSCDTRTGR